MSISDLTPDELNQLKRRALGNKLINIGLALILIGALAGILPSALGVMNLIITRLWMLLPMAILLFAAVICAIVGIILKITAGKPSTDKTNKGDKGDKTEKNEPESQEDIPADKPDSEPTADIEDTSERKGPRHGKHGRH